MYILYNKTISLKHQGKFLHHVSGTFKSSVCKGNIHKIFCNSHLVIWLQGENSKRFYKHRYPLSVELLAFDPVFYVFSEVFIMKFTLG